MKTILRPGSEGAELTDVFELKQLSEANSPRQWANWFYARMFQSPWADRAALLWNTSGSWELLPIKGGDPLQLPPEHLLIDRLDDLGLRDILNSGLRTLLPHFDIEKSVSIFPLRISDGWTYGALLIEHQAEEPAPNPEHFSDIWQLATLAADRLALRGDRDANEAKAKEVEDQQSNFMNIINHELRTPLTAILGFADLAYDLPGSREDDILRQFIEGIRFSGRNLSQRISELLTMGGISSATLQVERDECPMPQLIDEFSKENLPDIEGHERVKLPNEIPDIVIRADSRHFQRILVHLIDNALKFSEPETSVDIKWSLLKGRRAADRGDYLRTDVIDTGFGIQEEARERIFRKFYQIEQSNTRIRGGMGLGLTLAKEFTEAMGGELWMTSELGKGSTFSFTIPLVVEPSADRD